MNGRTGQSTVEYAVLIVVVIAALLAMSIFMKRGVMGKARESTNQIGEQFAPFDTKNAYTRTFKSTRNETTKANGEGGSKIAVAEVQHKTGTENVTKSLDSDSLF